MSEYIKMGWHIKDDGIFEFNYAPLSLEGKLKEKGFEIVSKEVYGNNQYCTIKTRFNTADELRVLLKIMLERNQQVVDDYKKERGITW